MLFIWEKLVYFLSVRYWASSRKNGFKKSKNKPGLQSRKSRETIFISLNNVTRSKLWGTPQSTYSLGTLLIFPRTTNIFSLHQTLLIFHTSDLLLFFFSFLPFFFFQKKRHRKCYRTSLGAKIKAWILSR